MSRRWFWLGGVGLLLAGAVIYWRSQRLELINLPPLARGAWVALGDSLTAGEGAESQQDFPTLLAERLGVRMVNLGANGETTAGGLARLSEVTALRPRVVLLCLGGNDTLRRVPAEVTFGNLGVIIDRLQADGAFVVLIGVRSASILDRNRGSFRSLAREKRVLLVPDILAGVLGNPDLMADAVHPNAEGYRRIAGRIEEALEPHLGQLR